MVKISEPDLNSNFLDASSIQEAVLILAICLPVY
jgi:hypothetical protein